MAYEDKQLEIQIDSFEKHPEWFANDPGNAEFRGKDQKHILIDPLNNIYENIRGKVDAYMRLNKISKHSQLGNLKSSQASCFNHLFAFRNDHDAVLAIAKGICSDITEIEKIKYDKDESQGYISFEVVGDKKIAKKFNYLNEGVHNRGANCTSIDAYIIGEKGDKTLIIPIEWKYTEHYYMQDKSTEDNREDKTKGHSSGQTRLNWYSKLINESSQLKIKIDDYTSSVYFHEPFYQLMRQTLLAETIIENEYSNNAEFKHLHIVPDANGELLNKEYKSRANDKLDFGRGMKNVWHNSIKETSQYVIMSPQKLLEPLKDFPEYQNLLSYLEERYWS